MLILGISAFYHDSAASLIEDGRILAAAQEERFTRVKHTSTFPVQSIKYCLDERCIRIDDLDAIVFYDKPLLKFERILETYFAFAPKGLASFLKSIPIWSKDKLFLKRLIRDGLQKVDKYDSKSLNLLFSEHHLSHAASAFYPSNFKEAAILTIDGVGEWSTATLSHGSGSKIRIIKELHFPHSLGLLYSSFTYFLGFKVNSGEYKLMGLAPYGNIESDQTKNFLTKIKSHLVDIKDDGSIWLNQDYFRYATGLKMIRERKWKDLFGFPRRNPDEGFESHHCNLARAIQEVIEDIVIKMAVTLKALTGSEKLCLAGGVALNCVANGHLVRSNLFREVFIQPAAGDAGGSLGAALSAYYMHFEHKKNDKNPSFSCYLGPEYSDKDIDKVAMKKGAVYHKHNSFQALCDEVAKEISKGKVVGWFQGRMEFGPRALGNRSILADPRNPKMQRLLNQKIKFRESFRPFAPSVLIQSVSKYFNMSGESPYMLIVAPIRDVLRKDVPKDYTSLSIREKLQVEKSKLSAITHVDFSARIQTVSKSDNWRYWTLLKTFKEQVGIGILINTSFNIKDEPIVCSPEDAYECFMNTKMDYLVIGDYMFCKDEQ